MFERALVCTDFTDGLYRLASFVPSLAATGIKQLVFLHTVAVPEQQIPRQDDKQIVQARDRLLARLGDIPAQIEVKVEVVWGKPVDHILSAIRTYQSDVVLIGTSTNNLLSEKLFGSTAVALCQRVTVPILIIRPELLCALTNEELDLRCRHLFRYLLIPYDASEPAQYMVQQIGQLTKAHPTGSPERCFLYTVVADVGRDPAIRSYKLQTAQNNLLAVQPSLETLNITVKAEVAQGDPVLQVLAAAIDEDITAIATSSRTIGKLIEYSISSFTGDLLRRSYHPILYFPPAKR